MPVVVEKSKKTKTRRTREEEDRRRRRARREERERERGDVYVYAPPSEKRSPRRPEVRVVGCSGSEELSAVEEEERDGTRRENRDGRDREERRSSGHRRRRRPMEDERTARHHSTASLSRSKTSSHRKESIQPLNFIRRTLSSASAHPDSRPVLKRSHTTSNTHLPKKTYESIGPPQTPKRSIFLDMFTPAIKQEEPVKLSGIGSSKSTRLRTGFTARRGGAGSGSSRLTTMTMGKAMVRSMGSVVVCPRDEETNRLLEAAKEAGWQRCYSCRTMVELKEGCNHMTCRCTAEFCMLCGLKWKTCACPWFNYENIDDNDRLGHMRVPMPHPPPPQPPGADPGVNAVHIPPPPRPPRLRRRGPNGLAWGMMGLDINAPPPPPPPPPPPAPVPMAEYNYGFGVGNAAGHHMNETYRRPVPVPRQ
ncbi:hypothetical protein V498_08618, partial [Pseudogymnoascus sp. VKM F-4517 (FW-2822)]